MLRNGGPRVCALKCVCILICQTALLTKGECFHISSLPTLSPQQRSEQKEPPRCLNFSSRCCVCALCACKVCVHRRTCVCQRAAKSFRGRLGGGIGLQKLHQPTLEKVSYPSTATARSITATLFLTAAEGEDQRDLDSSRRKHEKEVTGNE